MLQFQIAKCHRAFSHAVLKSRSLFLSNYCIRSPNFCFKLGHCWWLTSSGVPSKNGLMAYPSQQETELFTASPVSFVDPANHTHSLLSLTATLLTTHASTHTPLQSHTLHTQVDNRPENPVENSKFKFLNFSTHLQPTLVHCQLTAALQRLQ